VAIFSLGILLENASLYWYEMTFTIIIWWMTGDTDVKTGVFGWRNTNIDFDSEQELKTGYKKR
jgi:hypothetical protein